MSSKANVCVRGFLDDGEEIELWVYSHIGESTVEADVATGLSKVDPDKAEDPTSVFAHIFAAMSNGSGDSLYVAPRRTTTGYRTVEVDCRGQSVLVTSIYEGDEERWYPSFGVFITDVIRRNFQPMPGVEVQVAQLLDGKGLEGGAQRYIAARRMGACGVILSLAIGKDSECWVVKHYGSGEFAAYTTEEMMPL